MSAPQGPLADDSRPRIAPGFRLQWEPAQSAHVLLYPEGMLKLNQSAGEILGRCDGVRSVAGIIAELEQAFETTGIADDVRAFVRMAADKRWVVWSDPPPAPASGASIDGGTGRTGSPRGTSDPGGTGA